METETLWTEGTAQWLEAFLICVKLWIQSSVRKVVLLATEKKSVSITSVLESGISKRESPRPEGKMTQIKSNETQHKSHLQPVFVLRQQ